MPENEHLGQAAGLHPSMCSLFCVLCRGGSAADQRGVGRSEALAHVERLVVRLLLCYGACMHIARLLEEEACAVAWYAWVPSSSHFWHNVAQAVLLHVSDSSIDTAVEEFDAWADAELGVPAVQAAVGVLQCDAGSTCMHAAATRVAMHPSVLFNVVKQNIAECAAPLVTSACALPPFSRELSLCGLCFCS